MPPFNVNIGNQNYSVDAPSENDLPEIVDTIAKQEKSNNAQQSNNLDSQIDQIYQGSTTQPSQQNSSGASVASQFENEFSRGLLNTTASSINSVNGAVKLLNNVTGFDADKGGILGKISSNLNNMANNIPKSDNPFISIPANILGSAGPAIASYMGSGGPVGFIGRSAALSGLEAYNKNQNVPEAVGGLATGAATGALAESLSPVLKSASNILKTKGPQVALAWMRQQTNLSEQQIKEGFDKINQLNLNPFKTRNEYNQAKAEAQEQLSYLRENNKQILSGREKELDKQYDLAVADRKTAEATLKQNNQDLLDSIKQDQVNQQLSGSQKIADTASQLQDIVTKAKQSFQNETESILGGAVQKLNLTKQAMEQDINNATSILDTQGKSNVPSNILEARAKTIESMPEFKDLFTTSKGDESELRKILPADMHIKLNRASQAVGFKDLSSLLKEGSDTDLTSLKLQYPKTMQDPNLLNVMNKISNTGEGYKNTANLLKTIYSGIQRGHAEGSIPIRQINEWQNMIEKEYSGASSSRKQILSQLKKAITPSNIYRDLTDSGKISNPAVDHLKPLWEANTAYASKVDNINNSLNMLKDDQGNIKADNIFNIFDQNKNYQKSRFKSIDNSLPMEDRIYGRLEKAYNGYQNIKNTEERSLLQLKTAIKKDRSLLSSRYSNASKQSRASQANLLTANKTQLKQLSSLNEQVIANMKAQKDSEYAQLEEAINKRLNYLKIEEAFTSGSSPNNPALGYMQRHALWGVAAAGLHNPMAAIPAAVGAATLSPVGAAYMVRAGKAAIKGTEGLSKITDTATKGGKILRSLIASKGNQYFNR